MCEDATCVASLSASTVIFHCSVSDCVSVQCPCPTSTDPTICSIYTVSRYGVKFVFCTDCICVGECMQCSVCVLCAKCVRKEEKVYIDVYFSTCMTWNVWCVLLMTYMYSLMNEIWSSNTPQSCLTSLFAFTEA